MKGPSVADAHRSLGTLTKHLAAADWPVDFFTPDDLPAFLDRIHLLDYRLSAGDDSSPTIFWLAIQGEIGVGLPGLEGVRLVVGGGDLAGFTFITAALRFGSKPSLTLENIRLSLRFDPSVLKPASFDGGPPTASFAEIRVEGSVIITSDFDVSIRGFDAFDLTPVMIGNSGVIVTAQDVKLDLSRTSAIPEVIAAGFDDSFIGVFIGEAQVQLPPALPAISPSDLVLRSAAIGTGGISGRLEAHYEPVFNEDTATFNGTGAGELAGIPFGLESAVIEFKQNALVECRFQGKLLLPFFDGVVDVGISLTLDGALSVELTAPSGLMTLTKEDVLELELQRLGVTITQGVFTASLGGAVTPLFGGLDWPTFELEGLTIDSTGRVTISGGWIDLGKAGTIEVNGATIEITKFGIGSEEDGTKWIGFSGGLKLAEPIPVSGSVEGFKVLWRGSDVWAQLRGVAVGFEIPDSVIFAGHLEFFEDPEEPRGNVPGKQRGFRGAGSLTILPTNMKISSEIVLGRCDGPPPYAFAYLFVDFQSPVGIPLPLPNVAAYGFAGMFGLAMEPARSPNQHWWYDWYLLPEPGVSSSVKWRPARRALAFGVGVTVGTASDDGYAVNAKLLLVLVLPGPIVMLEGVAGFLADRTLLGPDSPIHALAVLDGRAGQFLMNVSARYPFDEADEMNKLIKARGTAEAYFDASGDWHLYLGQRDPRSKRIAAEILDLFEARAYTMLTPDQLAFGVWIGYVKHWKKGPLKVDLEAWMDANVRISWRPVQLAGDLTMVGDLGLRAFGIGASLNVRAAVAAQAPRPYQFHAEIEAKLRTPRFIPDPKFRFEWDYKQETTPGILNPIGKLGVEHLKVSEKWSLDGADSEANAPIVPLDGKVAISFQRSVADLPLVGGSSISGTPPWERAGKFEFRYRLTEVRLERRPKRSAAGAWETVAVRSQSQNDESKLWGVWLAADSSSASGESSPNAPMTKLMLHAKSPFEYARENADDSWYEHFVDWHPDFGWIHVTPPDEICHDFADLYNGHAERHEFVARGEVVIMAANLVIDRVSADRPVHLDLAAHNVVAWIQFPEPVSMVQLHFASAKGRVVIYDGKNQVAEVQVSLGAPGISTIGVLNGPTFTSLAVYSSTGLLTKLCYVTANEADRYNQDAARAASAVASSDHYDDPPGADLLLPQSFYRVTVTANGQRRRRGESDIDENSLQRVAYFQTGDPPGVFDQPNEGALTTEEGAPQYPSAGPLRDLSAYIAVQSDVAQTPDLPSGADASRATTPLNGALAAYRGYDVGVTFNENYVEQMYLMAGMPLVLSLYDNNGQRVGTARVASTPANVVPALSSSWQPADADAIIPNRAIEQHMTSRQRAAAQLAESGAAIGPVDSPLTVDTSIVYSAGLLNVAAVTPPQSIWVGGPDFVLQPRTLCRAALEPVRPAAVVHLDETGAPLRAADNSYLFNRIATDGSNLAQVLEDAVGHAAQAGPKLLSDGRSVIMHVDHDMPVADRPVVDLRLMQGILAEFSGSSASLRPSPQVYRWNFVTSAFVTFAHHMHSFGGAAWDRRRAAAVPWTPLDAATQAELRALIEADSLDEPALYAHAAAVFGLSAAALPTVVEIQVLEDANGRYGFLLESPEPLDWRRGAAPAEGLGTGAVAGRVSLALSQAPQALPGPSLAPSHVRVISCDIANEVIELLVKDDLDMSAFAVERVVGAGAVQTTEPIHKFPAGTHYRAGTRVRLATQAQAGTTAGPDVVEVGLGAQTEMLGDQAETIRVVDASGHEVHRSPFLPRTDYVAQSIVKASDADGTRTLIFVRATDGTWNTDLPDATYQLALEYRREAGTARPVLRRGGSTASEHVLLSFRVPALLP
jgi:hypothetical protein